MELRPPDLPSYERPPVDEVVIGLQFHALEGFDSELVASFWQNHRAELPKIQYQPRLETLFGPPPLPFLPPQPFQPGQAGGRTWLISVDDSLLVQLQDDRFIQNWRRRKAEYPRFERIHELFWQRFDSYRALFATRGITLPQVHQIDVTYINWIRDEDLRIEQFLTPASVSELEIGEARARPKIQLWNGSYEFAGDSQLPANLHVQCRNGSIRVGLDAAGLGSQFSLTYITPSPPAVSDDDMRAEMYRARDVIVRAFTQLTTPAAHEAWGRTQ